MEHSLILNDTTTAEQDIYLQWIGVREVLRDGKTEVRTVRSVAVRRLPRVNVKSVNMTDL